MIRKINLTVRWPEFDLDRALPVGKFQESINK